MGKVSICAYSCPSYLNEQNQDEDEPEEEQDGEGEYMRIFLSTVSPDRRRHNPRIPSKVKVTRWVYAPCLVNTLYLWQTARQQVPFFFFFFISNLAHSFQL